MIKIIIMMITATTATIKKTSVNHKSYKISQKISIFFIFSKYFLKIIIILLLLFFYKIIYFF